LKKKVTQQQGFIVLEVLISGLILTSSIAATMYLFRMGFDYLDRANKSNLLSSKIVQAIGLIKQLDLQQKTGSEDLGEGVVLRWEAQMLRHTRPIRTSGEEPLPSLFDIFLYRVDFTLSLKGIQRAYQTNVYRYKRITQGSDVSF
jgi:hypothetical protein